MSVLSDLLFPEKRSDPDFEHDDSELWTGSGSTSSGVNVTTDRAMRVTTVWACVRLLAGIISSLPVDLVVSIGANRFPERANKPRWMSEPDPADPTMTLTEHFAQVTTSLLLDGNFFVHALPSVMDPEYLVVLNPRHVEVRASGRMPMYDVTDEYGRVIASLGPMQMLHGPWIRMPGALRGLSPIQAARESIGLGITSEEFAARFFGQGASLSFGVEVPGPLTDAQKTDLRESMRQTYAGVKRSHSIGVLTGGAKFATGLGVTNEDAQFLESRKYTRDQIAMEIYGVPPHLVGSTEPGASSYNSVEQRSLEFRQFSVLNIVRRIETVYNRLVEVPDNIRAEGAEAAIKFNLDAIFRADLLTRFDSYSKGILAGVLKPNEPRAWEDLPPVPGGDKTYMQQQMVPLGTPPGTAIAGGI